DTTLGVIVGVLINYTISKPSLLNDILSSIERLRDLSFHLVRNNLLSQDINLDDYENKLLSLTSLIDKHEDDFYNDKNASIYFEFDKMIMKFKEIKIHLYCLNKIKEDFSISKENLDYLYVILGPEIINSTNKTTGDNSSISIEISTIYNYHLNEILTSLEIIDNWISSHSKKKIVL
ncbi:MAG: hypothetical protein Q4B63_01670, partial [Clostridium perfringens]|nr:hypothetical protein [Clostridium perfringens]